jgi:hypothetical protein
VVINELLDEKQERRVNHKLPVNGQDDDQLRVKRPVEGDLGFAGNEHRRGTAQPAKSVPGGSTKIGQRNEDW